MAACTAKSSLPLSWMQHRFTALLDTSCFFPPYIMYIKWSVLVVVRKAMIMLIFLIATSIHLMDTVDMLPTPWWLGFCMISWDLRRSTLLESANLFLLHRLVKTILLLLIYMFLSFLVALGLHMMFPTLIHLIGKGHRRILIPSWMSGGEGKIVFT